MGQLIIGTETTYSSAAPGGYLLMCRHIAIASGILNEIRVYGGGNTNVKAGLYEDIGSSPDELLTVNNSGVSILPNQWNTIVVPEISISESSYYWLAYISEGSSVKNNSTGVTYKYKSYSYSSGLPDPAGTGFTGGEKLIAIVGYENIQNSRPLLFNTL